MESYSLLDINGAAHTITRHGVRYINSLDAKNKKDDTANPLTVPSSYQVIDIA
jgi:hypothetical protein